MKSHATIAAAVIALAAPAAAQAQLPPVPKKAKTMTYDLVYNVTNHKALHELKTDARWPHGSGFFIANCVVKTNRYGRCDYEISNHSDTAELTCRRQVKVTIAKRTHRVRSVRRSLGCD